MCKFVKNLIKTLKCSLKLLVQERSARILKSTSTILYGRIPLFVFQDPGVFLLYQYQNMGNTSNLKK